MEAGLLFMDAGLSSHFVVNGNISRDKTKPFLQLPHKFEVRRTVEGVPSPVQQLQKVIGDMPPSQLHPLKTGGDDIAIKNRDAVSDPVPTIQQHRSHHPLCEQGHQSLHAVLYFFNSKLLEHQFEHPLLVLDWVHDRLRYEDGRVLGICDADLFEGILHEDFHVLPIFNYALRCRIAQLQQRPVF